MKKCFRTELAILAEIDEKELKLLCFDMTVKSLSVSMQIKITSEEASISCPHLFRFNNANDGFLSASDREQVSAAMQIGQRTFCITIFTT
jgi:hypothetical protein